MMKKTYEAPNFSAESAVVVCSKMGCGSSQSPIALSRDSVLLTSENNITNMTPVLPKDISTRADENGNLYVFEPSVQLIFEINKTGTFILNKIDGILKIEGLIKLLVDEYDYQDEEVVKREIIGFLERLKVSGFRLSYI